MISLAALLLFAASAPPLSCGAVPRPGVAELGNNGVWRGAAVEVCRKVARQTDCPNAQIEFHSYDSAAALREAANDRLAFLSKSELATPSLGSAMRAGPVTAVDRQVLVVAAN